MNLPEKNTEKRYLEQKTKIMMRHFYLLAWPSLSFYFPIYHYYSCKIFIPDVWRRILRIKRWIMYWLGTLTLNVISSNLRKHMLWRKGVVDSVWPIKMALCTTNERRKKSGLTDSPWADTHSACVPRSGQAGRGAWVSRSEGTLRDSARDHPHWRSEPATSHAA